MRLVNGADELPSALRAARSEAQSAFGDGAVYLERRLVRPRHVEIQLLGDAAGTVIPFVERECSIQRRHQKLVEESPSPVVGPALRIAMAGAARRIAASVGYTNAGTIEFLLDEDGQFYFLEMNTRLQVEHPVTEWVTGVDLVRWQFRLAAGDRLDLDPDAMLEPRGHAIELRVYAEDPDQGFLPSPGRLRHVRPPSGPGIRDDSGYDTSGEVPIHYDSLISKLTAWGERRTVAIDRLRRALVEYEIAGVRTTLPLYRWLLGDPDFLAARVDTTFLDRVLAARAGAPFLEPDPALDDVAALAMALHETYGTRNGSAQAPASRWTRHARAEALR